MTKQEYEYIQDRFTKKLYDNIYRNSACLNKEKAYYREGILACKIILSEIFNRNKN